ncbi:response regulator transcription factor [Novosphingobium sp. CF614]|uniref:response regulator transcription factor n=1 Tax=Novosphingobium sp. CF614 TaxID=1884364 RepID=UPI002101B803|nr:response regulator transcription factor [Novosphingobium sp. CF614]
MDWSILQLPEHLLTTAKACWLRTLLIEDDALTARAISETLVREGIECVWDAEAEAGLRHAATADFDVIIMDRMLPGMDGIAAIEQLRGSGIRKPVLMLSALGRAQHRVEGLDVGADDYLAKPFEPTELVARVRALHRRGAALANQPVIVHGDIEMHLKARTAYRAGQHLKLSPKEFDVLKLLMENAGQVVTRQMLLLRVWKLNFDPQTNVIDVNLVRLRRKLDEGFGQPWLETVRGKGYRLRPAHAN